ncbi:hypothetical protein [Desulfolucanica intricata]|uniref:hypothetical protein n=1 Tax=Desulfolucanica intricata TaxID=1285191 RepID=UPI000835720C|nr:hypothetical protein [Desulfolucanica intricata]
MQKLLLVLMAVGEGMIFFTGCCIIFSALGLILALIHSSLAAFIVLAGWFLSGLFMFFTLIKALRQGRRFVEAFDQQVDEQKKGPTGITSV